MIDKITESFWILKVSHHKLLQIIVRSKNHIIFCSIVSFTIELNEEILMLTNTTNSWWIHIIVRCRRSVTDRCKFSSFCLSNLECSLGVDVQADVVLLVDGSYSIGLDNFAKVRAFLEVLVNSFDIGPDKVQISLVQYSRDPHTEFYLNTHHDLDAVVMALRTFPYRGGSTNTGRAMTYVREKVFQASRGARANVPRVAILITDGKSSDAFQEPAAKLRNSDVEIFAVGVKDAVRLELEAIANTPSETHVYTVEDFDAFQRISKELTQSICLRIEQELRIINQRRK